jgi:drug/metabolite transporter (DMT)-like permease
VFYIILPQISEKEKKVLPNQQWTTFSKSGIFTVEVGMGCFMNEEKSSAFFQKTMHIVLLALCATFLWGAAYPAVKLGYQAFQVDTSFPGDLMVFAGVRFTLAGLAVLVLCLLLNRRVPTPAKENWKGIVSIGLLQTVGQYFFYYIGLAHTTGVRASILNSTSAFLTVLFSALVWREREAMTRKKWIGCLLGLSGVLLVNVGGSLGSQPLSVQGEGFILLASALMAVGTIASRAFTQGQDPMLITGWQLTLGGGVLLGAGLLFGGALGTVTPVGCGLMALMIFISAAAFTLWTFLLKYNPAGKVAVFSFLTPVFGALLSSLVLSESLFSVTTLAALLLVAAGIWTVNR